MRDECSELRPVLVGDLADLFSPSPCSGENLPIHSGHLCVRIFFEQSQGDCVSSAATFLSGSHM